MSLPGRCLIAPERPVRRLRVLSILVNVNLMASQAITYRKISPQPAPRKQLDRRELSRACPSQAHNAQIARLHLHLHMCLVPTAHATPSKSSSSRSCLVPLVPLVPLAPLSPVLVLRTRSPYVLSRAKPLSPEESPVVPAVGMPTRLRAFRAGPYEPITPEHLYLQLASWLRSALSAHTPVRTRAQLRNSGAIILEASTDRPIV
ncbi:hypothetical protein FB451DRAFT_1417696 [Mycena latifolia]|nr:hypothetical protein FB451DRAFT_1417696 [Mycena latifolia]